MKVAITADHRGLELKNVLKQTIEAWGHTVLDLGAHDYDPDDDYPDYGIAIAKAIQNRDAERGIAICGSGVGISVAANRFAGVRAAICHDSYSARQGVEHDDMNILCIGSLIVGERLATVLVNEFLNARFDRQEKFLRRLAKVETLDNPPQNG